jgi:PHP family Zn ribbon phosphoesterase
MKDVGKVGEPYGARPLYGKTIGLLVSRCHLRYRRADEVGVWQCERCWRETWGDAEPGLARKGIREDALHLA